MYARRIQLKKLKDGGTLLVTPIDAHGTVSIVGSISGGAQAFGSQEVASLHAQMLLEGTQKKSKKDIQILLDSIGASLSFEASAQRLEFTGRVRNEHLKTLIALIAEVLLRPTFSPKELSILKLREATRLSLESQDTRAQAGFALSHTLYAAGHPNRHESTEEARTALQKITTRELKNLHARTVSRSSLVLSVAGNVEIGTTVALVEKYFKQLPENNFENSVYTPAAIQPAASIGVPVANKASIDYMVGISVGITEDHPDYPALLLGLQILGNPRGFSGRLMKTVREEEGLTYGVYAYCSGFEMHADGYVYVWGTFAPQLFVKGRLAIKREIEKIVSKGVTALEVKKHREMYEAKTRVALSNSGAFAHAAHDAVVEGHKLSYLDEFPKTILKITRAEVNRALKRYMRVQELSETAAGPVDKDLKPIDQK